MNLYEKFFSRVQFVPRTGRMVHDSFLIIRIQEPIFMLVGTLPHLKNAKIGASDIGSFQTVKF